MKKTLLTLAIALILAAAGYLAYRMFGAHPAPGALAAATAAAASATVPELTQTYRNDTYHFSLMMPAGFTATESADTHSGGDTVVLQNQAGDPSTSSGQAEGIQIVISPFDEDKPPYTGYTLTPDRIHQDLPELAIADEQALNVGSNYTGLAFRSDNKAFGGASREAWFVFRGNLYQVSTYASLDPLLKAVFNTWQFN